MPRVTLSLFPISLCHRFKAVGNARHDSRSFTRHVTLTSHHIIPSGTTWPREPVGSEVGGEGGTGDSLLCYPQQLASCLTSFLPVRVLSLFLS